MTFRQYADEWLGAATCDESTRERLERQFRLHVYPTFGDRPLASIQPATIRAWGKQLQDSGMAASYRRNLFHDVSMILNAAVDDRKVLNNPCAVKNGAGSPVRAGKGGAVVDESARCLPS